MTTVVTAVYGGSDVLHPQVAQTLDVDWVCFTDDPDLEAPAPWRAVYAAPTHENPRQSAKVAKMTSAVDDTDVVWIDASMQVTSRGFVRQALKARRNGLAFWRHPRRDCVFAEAVACVTVEAQGDKYDRVEIEAQVAAYRAEGHPEHAGLYACGTIAWDRSDPAVVAFGVAWLAECRAWSSQDQLSLPIVLRRAGITPGVFPFRQIERSSREGWLANRWLRIHPHRNENVEGCVDVGID